MSSSSKLIQNKKRNATKYQKTNPVINSSQLVKQNKAKAIYTYSNNLNLAKQNAGTNDESVIFAKTDPGCNPNTERFIPRNNNNVIQFAKTRNFQYPAASSTNELTDLQNRNINVAIGKTLCCNTNANITTTLINDCIALESKPERQLKELPCPARIYPKVYDNCCEN